MPVSSKRLLILLLAMTIMSRALKSIYEFSRQPCPVGVDPLLPPPLPERQRRRHRCLNTAAAAAAAAGAATAMVMVSEC
jgi:hypothetical protein